MRPIAYVLAVAGVICGVFSTYPHELRFLPSVLLWGGVGAVIGLFVEGKRNAIGWGLLYGVFLLVGFFASRLAVSTQSLHNPVFVVLAIICTPIGAVVSALVGSLVGWRIREEIRAKSAG